jgi:predicted  nucleic acid-binding Zn-ribbon protein
MTPAARKETMTELKDAIVEISDELESAMDELKELKARIEALKEGKKWRVEAYRFLKTSKCSSNPVQE